MATIPNTAPDIDSANATLPSFEGALAELEGIVVAMEAGKMPLQDALDAYQRGIALLRQCQDTLSAAEQRLRILDADGLRDFEASTEGSGREGSVLGEIGDSVAGGEREA